MCVEEQKERYWRKKSRNWKTLRKICRPCSRKYRHRSTAVNKAMDAKTAGNQQTIRNQINSASGRTGCEYEKQLNEQEKLLAQVENQIAAAAAAKAAAR